MTDIKVYIYYGVILLVIILIFFMMLKRRENFENKLSNKPKENFHIIIDALLDNNTLGDKIVQEYNIKSMEELLQYNLESKTINSATLLSPYQENLIKTYIKYRDYYYINKTESEIVPIVRKNIGKLPYEFLSDSEKMLSLNLFRRNVFYYYDIYSSKDDFVSKIQWINKYMGLKDINYYINLLKDNTNHWFGIKNLNTIPNRICIYNPENNMFYCKNNKGDKIIQFKLKGNFNKTDYTNSTFIKTLDELQETLDIDLHPEYLNNIMLQNVDIKKYTQDFTKLMSTSTSEYYDSISYVNEIPSGNYLFVSSQDTTFTLDTLTKTLIDINSRDTTLLSSNGIDSQNVQYWIKNLDMDDNKKLMYVRNILMSYLNKIINSYIDLLTIIVYFNISDVKELADISTDYVFEGYWSGKNILDITNSVLRIGYCGVSGEFKITSTKKAWYFIYNNSNYYDYWTPVEVYIKQMNNSISVGLQLNDIDLIRSIAKFCYLNNKSFIDYLKEGARCENDTCNDVDVNNLYEPQRCQALKDKYVELLKNINTNECNQLKKTGKANPDVLNLMLQDVIELTLKLRKCQMDFVIPKKSCIDNEQNWRNINTSDQPNDTDLSIIQPDKSNNLNNLNTKRQYDDDKTYDQYNEQIDAYKKLLYSFEKIELDKLNKAANSFEPNKGYDQMTLSNFGGFMSTGIASIINDLSNYNGINITKDKDSKEYSVITNPNDPFNVKNSKDNENTKKNNENSKMESNMWSKIMKNKNNNNQIIEHFTVVPQGGNIWEPKDENNLENPKKTDKDMTKDNEAKPKKDKDDGYDKMEFKRIQKVLKDSMYIDKLDSGMSQMLYNFYNYIMDIVEILTKDDRIMFSGLILLFISFGLYFIDISS